VEKRKVEGSPGGETVNRHQKDLLRREGFVHGFVAARDPKTPQATLLVVEEAESAWLIFLAERKEAAE